MSAPIKHEENPKDPLLYAPPWVRGQRVRREPQLSHTLPPVPATAGAAPADSKINWPPSPAKLSRFEGDVAMSELRQRLSLDPHLVPGPPPRMQRRPVARSWLARLPLYIGLAAIAAYLAFEFNLSSGERTAATNSDTSVVKTARLTAPGEAQPAPQLVVEDRRALAGEPLPLRIVLIGATGGESVFLNGLVKGTRLSAGEPFSSTGWRVPARELGNVIAYAPNSFVGAMDAEIELRSANNTHLDIQIGRLEWIAKSPDKIAPPERQPDRADTAPPERTAAAPDAERLPRLIKRGIEFLKDGDIAASRLLLRHAAEAGNAQAALLLGSTFDPIVLAELGVYGLTGDRAIARTWYRTAAEYGSPEASLRIERLAAQTDK